MTSEPRERGDQAVRTIVSDWDNVGSVLQTRLTVSSDGDENNEAAILVGGLTSQIWEGEEGSRKLTRNLQGF
ncbi:uncharacterized protein BO95DRAFT_442131 [Aspergillus brunneoviolaceus CBS 621.78]|uniref:Uncharacterized protein n=1 Tax=Aspergillus brunneoviolaceus CBS 621.78 TaxID=1450534 RepID=A0ACD1GBM8_9EURO|nr:hypothetical protein BO95DRAFT_442131 [Aspergillus brunneoviolaceus CBS 621.78]RAH46625.1 hypothetical protein BO95DRAFT_442131 [Aspergillus brunneoviolaceus CBS 621.78]